MPKDRVRRFAPCLAAILLLVVGVPADAAPGAVPESRYVVGFDALPADVRPGSDLHGARVLDVTPELRFVTAATPAPAAFEARAAHDPHIRYVEADPVLPLAEFVPSDPLYATGYADQLVGAPAAWDTTLGSASVVVCVVDSGVRRTHEDLAVRYAGGIDLVYGDADPQDDNGHGTHVTGIATATMDNGRGLAGLAQVSFKHAKALDSAGGAPWSRVASAIQWCSDQGAAVITMSLGAPWGSTALQDSIDQAWARGAVVVASAGNAGPCTNCLTYPAKYANVLAVGCVTSSRSLCPYSSTGPELDLVAPGHDVPSTSASGDTAYEARSGTSMSAPFVAGAAALLKSHSPAATNADIRSALESSADDLGATGRDAGYGAGLLRVDRALAASPSPAPPAPTTTRAVSVSPASQSTTVAKGATATYTFTVTNRGTAADTFALTMTSSGGSWKASLSTSSLTIAAGASASVKLSVTAPAKGKASTSSVTVTAMSQADPAVAASGVARTTSA